LRQATHAASGDGFASRLLSSAAADTREFSTPLQRAVRNPVPRERYVRGNAGY